MSDPVARLNAALEGRYAIERELGEGGMATVYLADDLKHERKVALKVLRPELAAVVGAERFLAEIKTTANLQHPHILPLHDSGEADGFLFYVMPYVEGDTLKDRLDREKQLPVDEAVRIATDVAEALHSAHEQGVIHRDVKPANILLSKGRPLVADFGIALAISTAGGGRLTETGLSMGTPHYMSPEQALADREPTAASDVYSLGCVLYEMLVGEPPHTGGNAQVVLAKILTGDAPAASEARASIPAHIDAAIRKALERLPADRFAGSQDFARALADAAFRHGEPVAAGFRAGFGPRKGLTLTFVSMFVIGAGVAGWWLLRPSPPSPSPAHSQLTFLGDASFSAISPDGRSIAYITGAGEDRRVMVQDVSGGQSIPVFRSPGLLGYLRWSPDGSELLLTAFDDSGPYTVVVPRLGGTARRFDERLSYASWSPDGSRFAGLHQPRKLLFLTDRSTGETTSTPVSGSWEWAYDIDWSPSGTLLLFLTGDNGGSTIWTIRPDGTDQNRVIEDETGLSSPRWSPTSNAILYLRAQGRTQELWKLPVSPLDGRPTGPPSLLLPGLQAGSYFTVSADGKHLLYTHEQSHSNLWVATVESGGGDQNVRTRSLTTGTLFNDTPRISPDGTRVAFVREGSGSANIFVVAVGGGEPDQITFSSSPAWAPVWSPDGSEIAFGSMDDGDPRVWRVSAAGGRSRSLGRTRLSTERRALAWSPERNVLYQIPGNRNFTILDPATEDERALVSDDSVGWMFEPRVSPDATKVAVHWNRTAQDADGVWVVSLEESSQIFVRHGNAWPVGWSPDGEWVFVVEDRDGSTMLAAVPVAGGDARDVAILPWRGPDSVPSCHTLDGRQFVCGAYEMLSDVWLVENFDPDVR